MDTFNTFIQTVKTPAGVALSTVSALLGGAIGYGWHVLKCRRTERSAQNILDQEAQHLRTGQMRIDRHQREGSLVTLLGGAADITAELVRSLGCVQRELGLQHPYSTPSAQEAAADRLTTRHLAGALSDTAKRWLDGHVSLHGAAAAIDSVGDDEAPDPFAVHHGFTWLPATAQQARSVTLDRLRSDIHANISGVASFVDGGLQLQIGVCRGGGRAEAERDRRVLRDTLEEVVQFAYVWSRYLAWHERGLRGVLRQVERARLAGRDTCCMKCAEALRALLLVNPLLMTCDSVAREVAALHDHQVEVGGIPVARDLYRADQHPM